MTEQYLCTLDADLHECPFLKREILACLKDNYCCFRQNQEQKEPYKREPRWYEKYYKNW